MSLPVVTAADEALESLKELDGALNANQALYLEKKREIEEALLAVLSTRKAVPKPAPVVTLPTGRPSFPFLEPVENLTVVKLDNAYKLERTVGNTRVTGDQMKSLREEYTAKVKALSEDLATDSLKKQIDNVAREIAATRAYATQIGGQATAIRVGIAENLNRFLLAVKASLDTILGPANNPLKNYAGVDVKSTQDAPENLVSFFGDVLNELQRALATATVSSGSQNQEIVNLKAQVTTAQQENATLRQAGQQVTNQLSAAQARASAAEENLRKCQEANTLLDTRVKELEATVALEEETRKEQDANESSNVSDLNDEIALLKGQVTTSGQEITTLRGQIATLRGQITVLESDLTKARDRSRVEKDQRLEDLERENTELKATAETAAQEHAELIANLRQQAQQALAKSTTDSSNLVAQLRQQITDERSAATVALEEARRLLREEQARSALLADPSKITDLEGQLRQERANIAQLQQDLTTERALASAELTEASRLLKEEKSQSALLVDPSRIAQLEQELEKERKRASTLLDPAIVQQQWNERATKFQEQVNAEKNLLTSEAAELRRLLEEERARSRTLVDPSDLQRTLTETQERLRQANTLRQQTETRLDKASEDLRSLQASAAAAATSAREERESLELSLTEHLARLPEQLEQARREERARADEEYKQRRARLVERANKEIESANAALTEAERKVVEAEAKELAKFEEERLKLSRERAQYRAITEKLNKEIEQLRSALRLPEAAPKPAAPSAPKAAAPSKPKLPTDPRKRSKVAATGMTTDGRDPSDRAPSDIESDDEALPARGTSGTPEAPGTKRATEELQQPPSEQNTTP